MDQTGVRLLAISNERTYTLKGSRDVDVCGRDDKRAVTVCVASSAVGYLLPFQVIFQGKTDAVVPRTEVATRLEFLAWIAETHPWIKLLFVPAGCTSVYKPADVILQRPLKAEFTKAFAIWCTERIQVSISAGLRPINIHLDFSIRKLRQTTLNGLLSAHQAVGSKQAMIQDGWMKCGLGDISNPKLQAEAVLLNCSGELFEDRTAASTSEHVIEPQTEAFNELPMEIVWNATSYESLVSQAVEDLQVSTPFDFRGRTTRDGPSQFSQYLSDPNLGSPWM
ncbi:hypothetical protein R1sor_024866 [Riccia sorocarpa]|uniref:Uncharacterized protein n=1 Tax=Riccia sorocarpa TaxID=122646 RepID=A0ABD3GUX3_9MARC